MVRFTVRYDGKVLVPEGPVDLPRGVALDVTIRTPEGAENGDSLLALDGLGKDLWEGVDPLEYQRREREGATGTAARKP